MAKVSAKLNNIRISPRKSKIIADMIKGMDAIEAVCQLDMRVKKTSPYMKKLLLSAIANGESNFGFDKDNLFISAVKVGAGPTLKRWKPKAFGRAGKILKRTSWVEIILEEKVEGKGRKTKEEMEKEKKKRMNEKKKEEERSEKVGQEKNPEMEKASDSGKKEAKKKGWVKKMFRRKSM